MSVASLSTARAEDASLRHLQLAQSGSSPAEHQPAGACTPIGLTANGDIVFPWECRETIEKQRGPISISLPKPSNDAASREPSAAPEARKEDAVATAVSVQPKAEEISSGPVFPAGGNETSAVVKTRLLPKRASDLGRSRLGRKGQPVVALRPHPGSSGSINARKDRVALQPAAAQK